MEAQRAGEEARPGAARSEVVERPASRFLQARILRQAEVVVASGNDHRLAVDGDLAPVLAFDRLEVRVQAHRLGLVGPGEGIGLVEHVVGSLRGAVDARRGRRRRGGLRFGRVDRF